MVNERCLLLHCNGAHACVYHTHHMGHVIAREGRRESWQELLYLSIRDHCLKDSTLLHFVCYQRGKENHRQTQNQQLKNKTNQSTENLLIFLPSSIQSSLIYPIYHHWRFQTKTQYSITIEDSKQKSSIKKNYIKDLSSKFLINFSHKLN